MTVERWGMENHTHPRDTKCTTQLQRFGQRIAALHQRLTPLSSAGSRFQAQIVAELQLALEELRVSEEELHHQADALARSEQTLAHERQRYQDVFEFAPQAYVVTDANGTIETVNRAAAALLGVAPHAVKGKPLVLYLMPASRATLYTVLPRLVQEKGKLSLEMVVQRR